MLQSIFGRQRCAVRCWRLLNSCSVHTYSMVSPGKSKGVCSSASASSVWWLHLCIQFDSRVDIYRFFPSSSAPQYIYFCCKSYRIWVYFSLSLSLSLSVLVLFFSLKSLQWILNTNLDLTRNINKLSARFISELLLKSPVLPFRKKKRVVQGYTWGEREREKKK